MATPGSSRRCAEAGYFEGGSVSGRIETDSGGISERWPIADSTPSPALRREDTERAQNDDLINKNGLETALRHYQELFDGAPDAYIVSDAEGLIREANIAAVHLFDVRHERLIGSSMAGLISGPERRAFRSMLGRVASGEKPSGVDGEWTL